MSDVHEVLCKARNLIDRDGWVQNDEGGTGVGFCAMGACGYATDRNVFTERHDCWKALAKAVAGQGVRMWNDTPGRTKAEVLAAFDKAIAATAPAPADPFEQTAQLPEAVRSTPGRQADNQKQLAVAHRE